MLATMRLTDHAGGDDMDVTGCPLLLVVRPDEGGRLFAQLFTDMPPDPGDRLDSAAVARVLERVAACVRQAVAAQS